MGKPGRARWGWAATLVVSTVGPTCGGGVGGGAGEWRNWMAAAGAADGQSAHVLDYVPIYASPLGAGFAYWE